MNKYSYDEINFLSLDSRQDLSNTPVEQRPTLRQGSSGPWVVELQRELTQLTYYDGPLNGTFDARTNTAVRAFQTANRLLVDGIVGRNTWSALIFLYKPLAKCTGGVESPSANKHIVVAGDTLFSLASRFNTTVASLRSLNNLTSDTLWVGQKLLIPTTGKVNTKNYTVVAGDTLFSIANRFNTTVDAIRAMNNLTSNLINIGQSLQIPVSGGGVTPPVVPNRPTLRFGDRGDHVSELQRRLNNKGFSVGNVTGIFGNLTLAAVRSFQQARGLVVDGIVGPITWGALYSTTPTNRVHTVVSGDTLFSIARRFNTTVAAIRNLNNLTSDNLRIGQRLLIP